MKKKSALAITDDEKEQVALDFEMLQKFAEEKCLHSDEKLDVAVQGVFIAMFTSLPETRPLSMSAYIEFLVDHLATMSIPTSSSPVKTDEPPSKSVIQLLKACWDTGRGPVRAESGLTRTLAPEVYHSTSHQLARYSRYARHRDLDCCFDGEPGIPRTLAFKHRRNDALAVLQFLLLGYSHSPKLFNNIVQGLIPLLMICRKPEDLAFATQVCHLAQTLSIHFGDNGEIESKVSKARAILQLPAVSRLEALQTIKENSWKKSLQIQSTSASTRVRPKFTQPLGKVGLVNLGNSCFMNSALQALYCSLEFKDAILNNTTRVHSSKVMTTKLRETFVGLSTSRLSVFTPSMLYKALPDWLNDGHQQDATEFTKILFSQLEGEDPLSKASLSSFHGTMVNQIKCGACGNVSSKKEEFYDLTIPLSFTMLDTLPKNLILSLNRFEFDTKRSRRVKVDTPIRLSENIHVRVHDSREAQEYELYAAVVHSGKSANHGHYYTYVKEQGTEGAWLLYNDTSINLSSFEGMQQAVQNNRADTPYMLFLRQTGRTVAVVAHAGLINRELSNL
ncbi:Ubiquitin carboxyl-terminal hydrolase 35 [Podila epigama]|nr:Ubiquitin carboxyl-terminal hydrolase 35 [Podila epigama]